ncbi:hypothetical protein Q8791_27795 [Nocardiopsis sp. CT-R113]|uniref:Uncharacterized protein n=1 Tax=Nocardiopsis codii TaxID=3065942 RepID=A0ABU7KFK4_9ACTN|nr:hypothetical protein [Nocardiopsis sp. CT-R113]MEE2041031.1 hypothetical protein [Nocardiopsis sp. CT-R113]
MIALNTGITVLLKAQVSVIGAVGTDDEERASGGVRPRGRPRHRGGRDESRERPERPHEQ